MLLSDVCLTSVCRSIAYIGPKSRTERPRKTKTGIEIAHVTHDSDTTFNVKRSKVKVTRPLYSARPLRVRRLLWSAWERIRRGKVLLRCVCSAAREALGRPRRRGAGAYCVATRTACRRTFWRCLRQKVSVITRHFGCPRPSPTPVGAEAPTAAEQTAT